MNSNKLSVHINNVEMLGKYNCKLNKRSIYSLIQCTDVNKIKICGSYFIPQVKHFV